MSEVLPVADGIDPTRSITRRIVAWVVDEVMMVAAIAFTVWVVPIEFVNYSPAPGVSYWEPEGSTLAIAVFFLLPLAFWLGNNVALQGINGYTLGKFFLSLRTVRFDGRPPGLWRAFVRSAVLSIGLGIAGCFYAVFAYLMVSFTKGHRRAGDFLAGTFVVDALYEGHLITLTGPGAGAGPKSLYASEVSEAMTSSNTGRSLIEAQLRPNDPVFDKERDTYVVWNARQEALLAFDKQSKSWRPVE
jgi:uncharacterized RDD family membrane protein YckC